MDQNLTVEYDGSSNTIRSISGDFAESFTQNFTYQPKIGFSSISNVGTAGNKDAYTLTFSGGKLDTANAGDQAAQNKVKSVAVDLHRQRLQQCAGIKRDQVGHLCGRR